MNHLESATKIYESYDYGRFKILKGNREIDPLKIAKIVNDIESGINILEYAPIIVNEKMEIIDGQHRYYVSKKLKQKVYYTIMLEANLSTVPLINSKSSKWRSIDFLNSYVDLKKESYGDLKVFLSKYPKINLPVAISLYHKGRAESDKEVIELFQTGDLKNTHRDTAYKFAYLLKELEPYMLNPFSRRMFIAITSVYENGKYDHDLMLRKLKESGRRIENIDSTKSILEEMESIINYKSRERIHIV